MKKLLATMMALTLALSLCACGGTNNAAPDAAPETEVDAAAPETEADAAAPEVEASAEADVADAAAPEAEASAE